MEKNTKNLNEFETIRMNELQKVTGGLGLGGWFGTGYKVIHSLWTHRKSYGEGYQAGSGLY